MVRCAFGHPKGGNMKRTANLYKEYKEWVRKKNKKVENSFQRYYKEWGNEQEKSQKEYRVKLSKWKKERDFYLRLIKEWELKGFVYKIFNPKPEVPWKYGWGCKPRDYSWLCSFPLYLPAVRESWEGFMDWLVKYKYKIK